MSAVVVVRTLFPNASPRAVRRVARGSRLSHLVAIGCALVPLVAMGHFFDLGA